MSVYPTLSGVPIVAYEENVLPTKELQTLRGAFFRNCYPSKKDKEELSRQLGAKFPVEYISKWFKEERELCRSPVYLESDVIPTKTRLQLKQFSDKYREAAIRSQEERKTNEEVRKSQEAAHITNMIRRKLADDENPRIATIAAWAKELGIDSTKCQHHITRLLEGELAVIDSAQSPSTGRQPLTGSHTALPLTPTATLSPQTPYSLPPVLDPQEEAMIGSRPLVLRIPEGKRNIFGQAQNGGQPLLSEKLHSSMYLSPISPKPPIPETSTSRISEIVGLGMQAAAESDQADSSVQFPPIYNSSTSKRHSDSMPSPPDGFTARHPYVDSEASRGRQGTSSQAGERRAIFKPDNAPPIPAHIAIAVPQDSTEARVPRTATFTREQAVTRFGTSRQQRDENTTGKSPTTLDEVLGMAKVTADKAARVDNWWKTGSLAHLGFRPPSPDQARASTCSGP
ncbi:hypothetical protein CALVIDRAFT_390391 [Calocera viscosa TUFC12733]|uniref:Homeobox domain-containing protein n=1 Tax=Calocera viscosa (strain TUFC12733) TaxID=1330018 RepID=A0A167GIK4_CALVF|nr:hypothetical protein CALVIDRAFT_390391 [Calocera viscosa TUFC12733]